MAMCYDPNPTRCGKGPRAGTRALAAFLRRQVPGYREDGIYNCRNVRGSSSTLSLHADGRAEDAGNAPRAAVNEAVFRWAIANAEALGAQEIIFNHRIWSVHHPVVVAYHGTDPHEGHVHIGLCKAKADSLTLAFLATLPPIFPNGTSAAAQPSAVPAPFDQLNPEDTMPLPLPVQRVTSFGPPVKADPDGALFVPLPDPKHGGEVRWRSVRDLNVLTELIHAQQVSAGQPGHTHEDMGADVFDSLYERGSQVG